YLISVPTPALPDRVNGRDRSAIIPYVGPVRSPVARSDAVLSIEAAQNEFEPACVYVNTASVGLPPRRVARALVDAIDVWRSGRAEAADYDAIVDRARRRFAHLVGVSADHVAIGNQVSTFTGLVAGALPDGAHVLAAEEDFSSVLFPFLVHCDRGV